MKLSPFDWTVIALYFAANLKIGLFYARRARGSTSDFFLSGRDAPWRLVGASMVATTFAADTLWSATRLVVENGVAGNWFATPIDPAMSQQQLAYAAQQQCAYVMLTTVVVTAIAWMLITYLTTLEPREKLMAFDERVRPGGPGLARVRGLVAEGLAHPTESLAEQFVNWVLGCVLIYSSLFGIGYLIFKEWAWGGALVGVALVCAAVLSSPLSRAVGRESALAKDG